MNLDLHSGSVWWKIIKDLKEVPEERLVAMQAADVFRQLAEGEHFPSGRVKVIGLNFIYEQTQLEKSSVQPHDPRLNMYLEDFFRKEMILQYTNDDKQLAGKIYAVFKRTMNNHGNTTSRSIEKYGAETVKELIDFINRGERLDYINNVGKKMANVIVEILIKEGLLH